MNNKDDIATVERILNLEKQAKQKLVDIRSVKNESFHAAPIPPKRQIASKPPYPKPVVPKKSIIISNLISIVFAIIVVLITIHICGKYLIRVQGYRSVGQLLFFVSTAKVIFKTLVIYMGALGLGAISKLAMGSLLISLVVNKIRNSSDYKKICAEVDKEYIASQEELDRQYEKDLSHYNDVVLPEYKRKKQEWSNNQNNRVNKIRNEYNSIMDELRRLYRKLGLQDRPPGNDLDLSVLEYVLSIMKRKNWSFFEAAAYWHEQEFGKDRSGYYHSESKQEADNNISYFKDCTSLKQVKARYKSLMKKYHPDVEGGDEEIAKEINAQFERAKSKFQ